METASSTRSARQLLVFALLCGLGSTAACASSAPDSQEPAAEPTGSASSEITGAATTTTSTSPVFPAVGRVYIIPPNGLFIGQPPGPSGCSGTLVTPNHVITAAHCGKPNATYRFTLASPAPGFNPTVPPGTVGTFVPHPQFDNTSDDLNNHDIAVITLNASITSAQPARVFLGAALSEFEQGRLTSFRIAGYGGGGDSVRRTGPVSDIDWVDDVNNQPLFFEGNSAPNKLWTYDNDDDASYSVGGDSGGAMFAAHVQQGDVLVGVITGGYTYTTANPFGGFTETRKYATSIEDEIGFLGSVIPNFGDADGDGVNDNFDNCPPSRCLGGDMSKCFNPAAPGGAQADADGDGIGDTCDICTNTPNPNQKDLDNDGIGDVCDPAPSCAPGTDSDGDGVPDVCDNCANVYNPIPPSGCVGCTGQCLADGINFKCAVQTDSDEDGVGNACDLCPSFKASYNGNSNALAEAAENQAVLGDACDPSPLAILGNPVYPEISYTGNPPVLPPNLSDLTSLVGLRTRSFVGKKNSPTETSVPFAGTFSFRACSCVDQLSGTVAPPEVCATGPRCPALNANVAGLKWKLMTMPSCSSCGSGVAETFNSTGAEQGISATERSWKWDWRADVTSGKLPSDPNPGGTGPLLPAIVGTIVGIPPLTGRPREDNHNLRETFTNVTGGVFTKQGSSNGLGAKFDVCQGSPSCVTFLPDFSIYENVIDSVVNWPGLVAVAKSDSLGLIAVKAGSQTGSLRFDTISSHLDPGLLAAVSSPTPGSTWLTPVEPASKRGLSSRVAVLMPPTVNARESVLSVIARTESGGFGFEGRTAPPRTLAAASTDPSIAPIPLTGFRAVYSASKGKVLVTDARKKGYGVWSYDIDTQTWDRWLTKARSQPTEETLALAYDAERDVLYALVVDQLGTGLVRMAALVAYDRAHDSSRVLLNLPLLGNNKGRFLNVMPDGQVILTVARQTSWQSFRYQVTGNKPKFTGVHVGQGSIVGTPAMGVDEVYVPVMRNGHADAILLDSNSYASGSPCEDL